ARVRLAVQQLLGGVPFGDRLPQVPQRAAEQLPVRVGEVRGTFPVRGELLGLRYAVGEVRRRDIDRAQARVQPLQGAGVVCGRDFPGRSGFVVGTQRDHEAVMRV